MSTLLGVNLIPGTGEFGYDTVPTQGAQADTGFQTLNLNAAPSGFRTDYSIALDQLQSAYPSVTTVALVVAWFANSIDVASCQLYPSTNFIGGSFETLAGGTWTSECWRCSSLTQASSGLIPISTTGGSATYGGTPSDQSIVRCIQDLKARGFRVVFYPFILMDTTGLPWRGRITYAPDVSSAATTAVNAFLGSAATSQFTRDATNLTVAYSGSPTDWTLRRMILHYANLVILAGGVDLFLLGSEFRGIETIRGPAWTKAGTTGGDGKVTWDYPFVAGLMQLADDVRSIFDGAGLTKDTTGLHNLISYSADWSDWMGFQHPGENGQWPHLDQLYGHDNIDLVALDNYMPLSDWTTGTGGLDVLNWSELAPNPSAWPPSPSAMNGLGLTGQPTIYSLPYLKANIEGGEKFNWFYNDGNNDGLGLDPNGTDLRVSLPEGDRLTQSRNQYYPNQQLLANKQLRWWWNNSHQAVYDDGDGSGWTPHGPSTEWVANSKSITFAEYGVPTVDKGTNQPNVFYDPRSSESFTPYWSTWDAIAGGGFQPTRDDTLAALALEAINEYWVSDGNNESVGTINMIEPAFMSAWNWDARPFPTFPLLGAVWGDAARWPFGTWIDGKGPALPPPGQPSAPSPGTYQIFPQLSTRGWSVHEKPSFATREASLVSGRSRRAARMAAPLWEFELTYDLLAGAPGGDLAAIVAFFNAMQGTTAPFWFEPSGLSPLAGQPLGEGDGTTTVFTFQRSIGAYAEPLAAVFAVTCVYQSGVPLSPALTTIDATGFPATLTFTTAPQAGAMISADFSYYCLCRFADDFEDVEEFMAQLFRLQSLQLRSVKL
jgi:hypothetical protein